MQTQKPQKRELLASALKAMYLGVFAFIFLGVFSPLLKTIFVPAMVSADTSSTINFQARLQNAAGGVVPDGTYNVEFKIYDASTSSGSSQGSCTGDSHCLWTETRTSGNKVTVANGYMSVSLGSVTAFGGSINWNQQLYLTMNIGGTGSASWDGEMNPRLKLTATPYAFQAGQLAQYNNTTGYNSTLSILQPTGGNQTFQIQDQGAGGTYNLLTQNTANTNYIQNQSAGAQSASFWLNGSSRADTSVLSPLFDVATAGSLSVGTGTATSVSIGKSGSGTTVNGSLTVSEAATFNGNVTVAAGKSLTLTGGNTASRPGSPTEGMLYYDTDTKKLLVYSNSKWQASSQSAIVVAANNSSQADKDAADYVATGTGDQSTINSALTAADPAGSGRKTGRVILLAGTYSISDAISVPNNTTLAGQGNGTLIQLANVSGATNKYMITNTIGSGSGTGITVRDLQLDGNDSVNTTGSDYGVYLSGISGAGSTLPGATVINTTINNVLTYGLYLTSSYNSQVTNNQFGSNGSSTNGAVFASGNKITIANNTVNTNTGWGITLSGAGNSTVSSNLIISNTKGGILVTSSSSDNTISGNNLYNNGGNTTTEGIQLNGSSNDNLLTSNHITDANCSTNCYAVDINSSTVNRTYMSGNTLNGSSPTETINDAGTGTIYGGQTNSAGAYVLQDANGLSLSSATTVTGNLSQSGGSVSLQANASSQLTTSSGNLTLDATSGTLNVGTSTATISVGGSSSTTTVSGTLVVGSGGNTVTLTSTGYVLAGNARNTKTVLLAAEYPNAVLDNGTLGSNAGTMTSGIDLTNRMNYYKWTTTQVTNQTYDIDVQWLIPKDFDAWASNPLSVTAYTSNTTNGLIKLETRDTAGTVGCNFVSVTPGSTSTWTANNTACTLSSGTYTPGSYMTLRIRLQSPTSGDVRVGNIVLNYLSNK